MINSNKDFPNDIMANENVKLPKVYVVDQPYGEKYPLSEGFDKGTIFPALYDPYMVEK